MDQPGGWGMLSGEVLCMMAGYAVQTQGNALFLQPVEQLSMMQIPAIQQHPVCKHCFFFHFYLEHLTNCLSSNATAWEAANQGPPSRLWQVSRVTHCPWVAYVSQNFGLAGRMPPSPAISKIKLAISPLNCCCDLELQQFLDTGSCHVVDEHWWAHLKHRTIY